jgi:P-type Ca2+ transporter type 2C
LLPTDEMISEIREYFQQFIMNKPGLKSEEVASSRHKYGANRYPGTSGNLISIVTEVIREPMVLLLLVTCLLYFLLGEQQEGFIMLAAIILVAGISVFQQVRSEKALESLHKLTRQKVTVIRDGVQTVLDSEELVVGDRVLFSEGQQISADAQIDEVNDFAVDESILTGESLPVQDKKHGDQLLSGTTVNSGLAWATVTAVGLKTRLGMMGKAMEDTVKEKTPLQIQVARFVRLMAFFGIAAFVLVWLYNYIDSGDAVQSLLHGLTLAMAVLPEEIPVALATFMALGAYRMIRNDVLTRHPQTVEALGAATVICVDKTGTITENRMRVSAIYDFDQNILVTESYTAPSSRKVLAISMLASEEDPFDPMEKAIHEKYREILGVGEQYRMIHEYPISGAHPMMTHIYLDNQGKRVIAAKGAPEGIMMLAGLSEAQTAQVKQHLKQLASQGNRVLAVAEGNWTDDKFPETQQELHFRFLGLIALNDPPKQNISEVINSFHDSGIVVKMITGDYPETAMSIAAQAGIRESDRVLTGSQIQEMTDAQLTHALSNCNVLARVSPEAKLRIINCLKSSGEVVAMTGDGVNDGPALKSAHIGVAMGKRGSEVARKAASLILVNDDLGGMVKAVESGRSIYSNLKKAIRYIITIHIPLISVVTIPVLLAWKFPNLFSPVHVIFLELIMGPTCSIVYENEPFDRRLMKLKPRKMTESLFNWKELSGSVIQGLVIAAALLGLMFYLTAEGSDETRTRTMVFTAMVISNIMLTLTGRSDTQTIFSTIRYRNVLMPVIIIITLAILTVALLYPPVMNIFEFESISSADLLLCTMVALAGVVWIEGYKKVRGAALSLPKCER